MQLKKLTNFQNIKMVRITYFYRREYPLKQKQIFALARWILWSSITKNMGMYCCSHKIQSSHCLPLPGLLVGPFTESRLRWEWSPKCCLNASPSPSAFKCAVSHQNTWQTGKSKLCSLTYFLLYEKLLCC